MVKIRITDFLPAKYNADSDPEVHILGFKDYLCAQLGVSTLELSAVSQEKVDLFKFTLKGEARLWYESTSPFNSIKHLEHEFLQEYASDLQSRTTAVKALAELKYHREGKLCTFINKILRLNKVLGYSDSVLMDKFLASMPNDIRRLVRLSEPKTLKESIAAVKQLLQDEDKSNNENVSGTMVDMAMSVQALKSEIHNMAESMKNRIPGRIPYQRYNYRERGYDSGRKQSPCYNGGYHRRGGYRRNRSQYTVPASRLYRNEIRCFACGNIGHMQNQCPMINMMPQSHLYTSGFTPVSNQNFQ